MIVGTRPLHVFFGCEAGPRERIAALEFVDAVRHRPWLLCRSSRMPLFSVDDGFCGNGHMPAMYGHSAYSPRIRCSAPSRFSWSPVASVRLPPPLSPATMMRCGVDAEFCAVRRNPLQAGDTVVQPGRITAPLPAPTTASAHCGSRPSQQRRLAPRSCAPTRDSCRRNTTSTACRRRGCSTRTRTGLFRRGTNELDVDRVAVRLRRNLVVGDRETGRRRDGFGIAHLEETAQRFAMGDGFLRIGRGQQFFAVRGIALSADVHRAEQRLDAWVDPRILGDSICHRRSCCEKWPPSSIKVESLPTTDDRARRGVP